MTVGNFTLKEDYWESFSLHEEDVEFLYNHLIETETPLTSSELLIVLVEDRIRREKEAIEKRRSAGGEIYLPKKGYKKGQTIIFPALGWLRGDVVSQRSGRSADQTTFDVIQVEFAEGHTREFAINLDEHRLNNPGAFEEEVGQLNPQKVLRDYGKSLISQLESGLQNNDEFISIAGRWFPRALLVDVNVGHLNLAEAVLDLEGGGPLPTNRLLETLEMPSEVNQRLVEFSLDYALWKDDRFDEVGPAGKVLWFLTRLEPKEVIETPHFLKYQQVDYDRSWLVDDMLSLEI